MTAVFFCQKKVSFLHPASPEIRAQSDKNEKYGIPEGRFCSLQYLPYF
jgi:hypothetical protein